MFLSSLTKKGISLDQVLVMEKKKGFPHPLLDSTQRPPARVDLRLTTDLLLTFSGLSLGFVGFFTKTVNS